MGVQRDRKWCRELEICRLKIRADGRTGRPSIARSYMTTA